ncbi:MAG TPA: Gfo/Idh/MocA family oxidoreductase [Planctomycetota bacterium]|jgi:predicted dehydrogenase|nr:Gfo/Idh/MocA family oxidoreductase [Planctomycetota bacterium]
MGKRLGVGIVGAGFVAKFHIRSFVGVRDADVVAVASPRKEKAAEAARLARELGVGEASAYDDLREMVRDPAVQAVWICSPNHARLEAMEAIAESGKGKVVGIACEKPLGRNVREAKKVLDLSRGFLTGYLENQVFMPSIARGKEILWRRGAAAAGRPYLARCAEEHGGPHEAWFWSGKDQGGGVLNDMMCHSLEAARHLVTTPGTRDLTPATVNAEVASLKWTRPPYAALLKKRMGVDFAVRPVEDFARASVAWRTPDGQPVVTEATTSWSFVGPGLRLSFETMGPEYYLQGNTLESELKVFFSREVKGAGGEDIVEKQTAEQGLMPVVADEESTYGYTAENRHMVRRFLEGRAPDETFEDGLRVTQLLMACYMSAERGAKLAFPPEGLDAYEPPSAKGTFRADDVFRGAR